MKRRLYGPDHDPVSRRVGEDVLGRALRELCSDAERRLLLRYLHGAPPQQLARDIGLGLGTFEMLVGGLLNKIGTSKYADALRQELSSAPRHSSEVWAGAAEVPAHRCERTGCVAQPFAQRPMGRPRRFCSSACRQAAYRERLRTADKQAPAETKPEGPRPARLTDYSAALPAFPEPRDWSSSIGFWSYLNNAVKRWHSPATEIRDPLARPQLSSRFLLPRTLSVIEPDALSYALMMNGSTRLGGRRHLLTVASRREVMRAGVLSRRSGWPSLRATSPEPFHRQVRSGLLPPTLTSPMAICVPEPQLERRRYRREVHPEWSLACSADLVRVLHEVCLPATYPLPFEGLTVKQAPPTAPWVWVAGSARRQSGSSGRSGGRRAPSVVRRPRARARHR